VLSGNPEGLKTETGCPIENFGHDRQVEMIFHSIMRILISRISSKRERLEAQRKRLQEEQKQAEISGQMRKSIVEYCRVISGNLLDISNDFESKRHLLHLLIEKIEIFRDKVKIYAVVPNPVDNVIAAT
jgi:division protein CdvB (Snf7/Vps24/ESCRT-III family)